MKEVDSGRPTWVGPNDPYVTVRTFPNSTKLFSELTSKFRKGEITREEVERRMKAAEEEFYRKKELESSDKKELSSGWK